MRTSRKTEGKMPTTTRFDLGGGGLPGMPSFSGSGKKLLQLAIVVLVIILLMASTTSIPTGHVGVLTLFGRVTGQTLPEGIHLVNPLKSVQKMSVQTQSVKESANVPSNEGLILALDTSLLFRLDKDKAAYVYQTVGDNYAEKIVEPTLRAAIRASTSAHSANALYTNARELVQQQIQDELHPAEGKARGGAQAHRSAGYCRLPEDCGRGHQPAAARMEGHRGYGEAGGERECQDCDHWESEERASPGAGTEIIEPQRPRPSWATARSPEKAHAGW